MRFAPDVPLGRLKSSHGELRVDTGTPVALSGGVVLASCWAAPPDLALVGFARPGVVVTVEGRACAGAFFVAPGETAEVGGERWTWRPGSRIAVDGARLCGYCHGLLPERRGLLVPTATPPFDDEPLCVPCSRDPDVTGRRRRR